MQVNGSSCSLRLVVVWVALSLLTIAAGCTREDFIPTPTDGDSDRVDADGDRSDGEIPVVYVPDGDSDHDPTDGDVPDGDEPDGNEPDGDEPDGDVPDGDVPDGDEPDGDVELDSDADPETDSDVAGLRVATFNVHMFFDKLCDSGQCDPGDFEIQYDPAGFDEKVSNLADAIADMNLDIVLLQEVEKDYCLNALGDALDDRYTVSIVAETYYSGSLDVALLARGALKEQRSHKDEVLYRPDGTTTTFTRDFLEAHLEIDGKRVIVFVAHFKAKTSDDPGRRLAEAQKAYEIVSQRATEYPDALIIMGGDLNDTPGSDPIDALESSGKLLRVAVGEPLSKVGTYEWNGNLQAIDHLFIATEAAGSYVSGSVGAVRGTSSVGLGGSDHAALRAVFTLP